MILKKNKLTNILSEKALTMVGKNKIKISFGSSLLAAMLSTGAYAGLYVYPVEYGGTKSVSSANDEKRNVSYHNKKSEVNYYHKGSEDRGGVSPSYSLYEGVESISNSADMTVNTTVSANGAKDRLPCYGKNVPLDIAIENIFGGVSFVNFDDESVGTRVSWQVDECNSRKEIIDSISNGHGVDIYFSEERNSVGVTSGGVPAEYYSYQSPLVWKTNPSLSLKGNISDWAERIDWKVHWPKDLEEVDFQAADTTLYGELIGEGGVIHRVISQISKRDENLILSVDFYRNKHAVIRHGGHQIIGGSLSE